MIHLLTSPSTRRNIRGLLGTVSAAVRSVVAPATLVEQTATETPAIAADPADTYTADEMPELVAIERAALGYDLAADNARRADRAKRAARKVLDRLPAGTYGNWIVERVTSNRQTADLDAIRAIFKANGLGPVPMKANAPSLRVTRAELGAPADDTAVLAAV
ncbi:hypothetical protein F3K34_27240 [Streptomyces sp. LBUM 1486]|uniref:hypothetical protein n=1 Tax=Streptomyces scabiei TaxID=1930 RepID=UPI001B33308A|nr:hypothetical protein [Streptomyces sp. LBUM 1486]MBP5915760.1 hypothetical protein [Streptomyces sp. LBUM 1486]